MSLTDTFRYKRPDDRLVIVEGPLRVNVGCGHHYADGWINTDVRVNDDTHPDLIVTSNDPMPFPSGSAERIFLGHVLEHVQWDDMQRFLFEVRETLAPGGHLLVTGPDTERTLQRWKAGLEPWALVQSVLEHAEPPERTDWPEACHQWNCSESRVVAVLEIAGFVDIEPLSFPPPGWPVVNWGPWQCCVSARRAA